MRNSLYKILFAALSVLVTLAFWKQNVGYSYVTIVNADNIEILSGEVSIERVEKSLVQMKPGEERILKYKTSGNDILGDDLYKITVQYSGAKEYNINLHHTNGGNRFDDKLFLSCCGANLVQSH